ncbi:hypothetical protein H5P36_19035 [Bacillus sp. APMAM]|nr:hypothetical protein [Bacillus sp. APMAM]RTZ54374.1 hypothetical protein EKO25_18500 [Bacillus sp. SAJ1]
MNGSNKIKSALNFTTSSSLFFTNSEDVSILNTFRQEPPKVVAGYKIVAVEDYQTQVRTNLQTGDTEAIQLPKSNVLKYFLENGAWFCVRPSGTEPKAKFYFGVNAKTLEESKQLNARLQEEVMKIVESM